MPSAFLTSKAQDVVSDYCSRSGVSDCHKAEVAHVLLSLKPTHRVYLIEALNALDREELQEGLRAMNDRLKNIERADAISSTLGEGQEVDL